MQVQSSALVPVQKPILSSKEWGKLPRVLIIEILKCLANDPKTFLKCSALCKNWRAIILDPATTAMTQLQNIRPYLMFAPPPRCISSKSYYEDIDCTPKRLSPNKELSVRRSYSSSPAEITYWKKIFTPTIEIDIRKLCPLEKVKEWDNVDAWDVLEARFFSNERLITVSNNGVICELEIKKGKVKFISGISLKASVSHVEFHEGVFFIICEDRSKITQVTLSPAGLATQDIPESDGHYRLEFSTNCAVMFEALKNSIRLYEKVDHFFQLKWKIEKLLYAIYLLMNENYIIILNNSEVFVYNPKTGEQIWNFKVEFDKPSSLALLNHYFINLHGNKIQFFDLRAKQKLPFEHSGKYFHEARPHYLSQCFSSFFKITDLTFQIKNKVTVRNNKTYAEEDINHHIQFGPNPKFHEQIATSSPTKSKPIITRIFSSRKGFCAKLAALAGKIGRCFKSCLKKLFCCKR